MAGLPSPVPMVTFSVVDVGLPTLGGAGVLARVYLAAVAAAVSQDVPAEAPDFVQRVTARMLAGEGDIEVADAHDADRTHDGAAAMGSVPSMAPIFRHILSTSSCTVALGSMALAMRGGQPSWIAGEFPQAIGGHWLWGSLKQYVRRR